MFGRLPADTQAMEDHRAHIVRRAASALGAAVLAALVVVAGAPHVHAAGGTFTVNTTVDGADANQGDGRCATASGACSLRAAIQEANQTTSATTITLPAGRYVLDANPPGTFGGVSRALELASSITINGAGSSAVSIVGSVAGNHVLDVENFYSQPVKVTVSGVTISGGTAAFGAGIYTGRDVNFTLTDSVVTGNAGPGSGSGGGGIYAYGQQGFSSTVTLARVTISGNSAGQGGGIVDSYPVTMNISDSAIANNAATGPYAGGVRTNGTMTMTNTTVSGNYAGFGLSSGAPGGGGIYSGNPPAPASQTSSFTMTGGSLANNSLPLNLLSSGGGLLNETSGTAVLSGVTISGNSAFTGGGILNDEGKMTVSQATVKANNAFFGAGLYNNDFYPTNSIAAVALVQRSTISGNTATDYQCPYQLIPAGNLCGAGGGAFNENGDLTFVNSTVAENSAGTFGGGVYNLRVNGGTATVHLTNATVSANYAARDGGGLLENLGSMIVKNSIAADNLSGVGPTDCFLVPGSAITSAGNNISTDGRCGFSLGGDRFGSPQLTPLASNGGSTATMMPISGSPAVGAGDNATCASSLVGNVDQRGVARPVGNVCDIGAVEGETARPATTNAARPSTYLNGVFSFRPDLASGAPTGVAGFGLPTDTPLMCDFDGDGTRSLTVVRVTGTYLTWYHRTSNTSGPAQKVITFGSSTDTPVCGDWDGNGTDTPGVLRNVGGARMWIESNTPDGSGALNVFYFGAAADRPMYGDWDGNGTDTPGIVRPVGGAMLWSYRNSNSSGTTQGEFYFGSNTDRPVVGDWDGNGADSPGVVRVEGANLRWWYRNTIVNGIANGTFLFGSSTALPAVWKGSGVGGL